MRQVKRVSNVPATRLPKASRAGHECARHDRPERFATAVPRPRLHDSQSDHDPAYPFTFPVPNHFAPHAGVGTGA
jgi:hypothetical protein